jgi:acyl carrier protein
LFNLKQKFSTAVAEEFTNQQDAANSDATDVFCSAAIIQHFMQERIGAALGIDGKTLDLTAPVTSYGLDSITSFTLTLELAEFLDRDLPASLIWEFPSIAELAQELGEDRTPQLS